MGGCFSRVRHSGSNRVAMATPETQDSAETSFSAELEAHSSSAAPLPPAETVYGLREQQAATSIQNAVRGYQSRQFLKVTQPAPGITHVRIKGNATALEQVGIGPVNTTHGPKEIQYLRLDGNRFNAHVIGGNRIFADVDMGDGRRSNGALVAAKLGDGDKPVAYINGGFYNAMNAADRSRPRHAPIGTTTTHDGQKLNAVPVPIQYRDVYRSVGFADGSNYTSGPVLAEDGHATFPEVTLGKRRFQFPNVPIKPGELSHAEHPNPRAAVSIPENPGPGRDYRLAVALSNGKVRGAKDTGMTMPEWSRAMARLSSLNRDKAARLTPESARGLALNNDGGPSVMIGVVESKPGNLVDIRQVDDPRTSTLLAFSPSEKPEQPYWLEPEE